MLSILNPAQPLDPATQKEIAVVRYVGIALTFGLAFLAFASFLNRAFPAWVGVVALIAQAEVSAIVIKKILRLRNPPNTSHHPS